MSKKTKYILLQVGISFIGIIYFFCVLLSIYRPGWTFASYINIPSLILPVIIGSILLIFNHRTFTSLNYSFGGIISAVIFYVMYGNHRALNPDLTASIIADSLLVINLCILYASFISLVIAVCFLLINISSKNSSTVEFV